MLRRLSVFAGSFPLELVQQATTTPDLDDWAALDALSGLLDKVAGGNQTITSRRAIGCWKPRRL
ncbi:MAG: hypothetical protein IPI73_23225 [Betaproteobacteria bacterium]|nr:hypothetical protein [Betaproteobacteria bacterium]